MKIIRIFLGLLFVNALTISCVDENESNANFVGTISDPSNISALVSITQDNSGLVTITPLGEGVVTFHVDYGDGSDISDPINPGNSTEHIYQEGTYEAIITGTSLNGSSSQGIITVVVSFIAPENLVVQIINSSGSYDILVSATADYATSFEVLFGDELSGETTPMQIGEQLSHTYEGPGTYNIIVTALSGGSATTEYSEDVVITDPPVFDGFSTFEDFEGVVPANFSFGGVDNVQVVANPDNSGINTSSNVMQCTKGQGAEIWGGMGFAVNGHINFNGNNVLRLKSYAPEAGKVVKVKLETSAGNVDGLTYEFDMVTTVANQWEILTYDFSAAPDLDYVSTIVFYDFGNQDSGVYHFDDLEVGIGEYIQSIEDFEDEVPETFSFGGVTSIEVISNPDPSVENTTTNVLQFVKDNGAEIWGGMGLAVDVINFNGAAQIHLKSYAPETGKVVKVKLETSAGNVDGLTHEVDMITTVANQWETLVYDFTGAPDLDYVSFIVFYDFGNTDGATYRFDEIQLID